MVVMLLSTPGDRLLTERRVSFAVKAVVKVKAIVKVKLLLLVNWNKFICAYKEGGSMSLVGRHSSITDHLSICPCFPVLLGFSDR